LFWIAIVSQGFGWLGGSVAPGPTFEIGMVPVTLTDAGKTDSVFSQLPSTFEVFQWHGERDYASSRNEIFVGFD
jgi:GMP synthase-like glutamine amidotransferase